MFVASMLLFSAFAQAQITITKPPSWGPTGYTKATYYYIPDVETYYDISKKQYIYQNDGKWTRSASLPAAHKNYNLYNGYKVVLTDTDPAPYKYFKKHKVKYYKGYKGKPQKTIGVKPAKTNNGKSAAAHAKGKGHANGKGHNK